MIPFSIYQRALDADSYPQRKKLLSSIKTVNYNVFYYLMAFLRDCVLKKNPTPERVRSIGLLILFVIYFLV